MTGLIGYFFLPGKSIGDAPVGFEAGVISEFKEIRELTAGARLRGLFGRIRRLGVRKAVASPRAAFCWG